MSLSDDDKRRIVQSVRALMARERISREEFAQRARLGKSTVDKLFIGLFSEKTVLQIEQLLDVKLLSQPGATEIAPDQYGGYTRDEAKPYIGDYIFARPSFTEMGIIHGFHMQIRWEEASRTLVMKEPPGKALPVQFGEIYIPKASTYFFVLANEQGWLKQVILSQIDAYKRMKGLMLTMGHAFANVYMPVALPVILNKYPKVEPQMVGALKPGSKYYSEFLEDLKEVQESRYASWISMSS